MDPADLKGPVLAQLQDQRQSLESVTENNGLKAELTFLKQEPGATPHRQRQTVGRTWWPSLLHVVMGERPLVMGEVGVRLAQGLPAKSAVGTPAWIS